MPDNAYAWDENPVKRKPKRRKSALQRYWATLRKIEERDKAKRKVKSGSKGKS